jgi:hypothetical protein
MSITGLVDIVIGLSVGNLVDFTIGTAIYFLNFYWLYKEYVKFPEVVKK